MDDKEFDKLMTDYVQGCRQDRDKIIKVVKTSEEAKEKKKFFIPKKYFAVGVCVLVVAIALSVFLPIYLKPNDVDNSFAPEESTNPPINIPEGTHSTTYGSTAGAIVGKLDSQEESESALGQKMLILDIDCTSIERLKYLDKDTNLLLGVENNYLIYGEAIDENIDLVTVGCYYKNVETFIVGFENYKKTITVKDISINYNDAVEGATTEYPTYCYYLNFEYEGLKYFVVVKGIDEIDVTVVLQELLP